VAKAKDGVPVLEDEIVVDDVKIVLIHEQLSTDEKCKETISTWTQIKKLAHVEGILLEVLDKVIVANAHGFLGPHSFTTLAKLNGFIAGVRFAKQNKRPMNTVELDGFKLAMEHWRGGD